MRVSTWAVAVGICFGLVAPVGGDAIAAGQCALGSEYQVISVGEHRTTQETGGWAPDYRRLSGAELRVAAQPGLTQEWLERRIESQIATGECHFGVPVSKVDVLSAGDGFVVRLNSADERAASEILRHARALPR